MSTRGTGAETDRLRRWLRRSKRANQALAGLAGAALVLGLAAAASAAEAAQVAPDAGTGSRWIGLVAAALATGLPALGAGYAVAVVGAASVGAMAERPELAARALIFVGLAEGIAIYGLIISVMILGRL
jgi:V/A-type H+-transporting ATPase subunit K